MNIRRSLPSDASAIAELEKSPYPIETMEEDKAVIASKLGISTEEFDKIISGENKTFEDYKNSFGMIQLGTKILRGLGIEKKKFR